MITQFAVVYAAIMVIFGALAGVELLLAAQRKPKRPPRRPVGPRHAGR